MPAALIIGPVASAVLAALQAAVTVTAQVPADRIVDEVPSRPTYPLIVVEDAGEDPFNTLGAPDAAAFGSTARVGVRVLSQYRGDTEIHAIQSAVRGALDGLSITVPGFPTDVLTFDTASPVFKATANLIVTREQVAIYALTVHQ